MTCPQIDHVTKYIAKLITQYRESSNLIDYITVFLDQSDDIEEVLCQFFSERWIDTAEGAQLDIIGLIVGQPRVVPEFEAVPFFGFFNAIGAGTFGTIPTPGTGEVFRSIGDVEYLPGTLTDAQMRTYIRAKIKKNHVDYTSINEIISVVELIAPVATITITEGTATFNIDVDTILTDTEKLILLRGGFIPKPAGVSVTFSDQNGAFAL